LNPVDRDREYRPSNFRIAYHPPRMYRRRTVALCLAGNPLRRPQ